MTVQVKAAKLNTIAIATGTPTTASNVVPFLIQQNPLCPAKENVSKSYNVANLGMFNWGWGGGGGLKLKFKTKNKKKKK